MSKRVTHEELIERGTIISVIPASKSKRPRDNELGLISSVISDKSEDVQVIPVQNNSVQVQNKVSHACETIVGWQNSKYGTVRFYVDILPPDEVTSVDDIKHPDYLIYVGQYTFNNKTIFRFIDPTIDSDYEISRKKQKNDY